MKKGNTRSQGVLDARKPSHGLSHAHASTNVHYCTGDCHSIRLCQWRSTTYLVNETPISFQFPGRAPCRWDGATHSASLDVRPLAVAGIAGRRCKHRSVRPSLHDRSDVCRLAARTAAARRQAACASDLRLGVGLGCERLGPPGHWQPRAFHRYSRSSNLLVSRGHASY